jgi:ABC transporter substrate binding protein
MRRFAMELVALQPDVLLSSTTPTTTALLQQTRTIPIVFALAADSIGRGFVANLARPGGTAVSKLFGSKAGILWIRARRSTSAHAFTGKSRLDRPRPALSIPHRVASRLGQEATAKKQRPRGYGNDRRSTSRA